MTDGQALFWLFVAVLYFGPTINAVRRRHRNLPAIAALNVLLGWTVLGWIVAEVWSWTKDVEARPRWGSWPFERAPEAQRDADNALLESAARRCRSCSRGGVPEGARVCPWCSEPLA